MRTRMLGVATAIASLLVMKSAAAQDKGFALQQFEPAPAGDRFFGVHEHQRLADLMARWRAAQELGQALPTGDQAELSALVEAELRASAARTAALADEIGR